MRGTSVTCVLIGSKTANSRWVRYEIKESIRTGNGLLGIYIHHLKDKNGNTCHQGINPLADYSKEWNEDILDYSIAKSWLELSEYKTYDWKNHSGRDNLGEWIELAAREAGR